MHSLLWVCGILLGEITEYPEASHDIQSGQHSRQRFRFQCLSYPCGNSEISRLDEVLPCAGGAWAMRCCPGPQLTALLANLKL